MNKISEFDAIRRPAIKKHIKKLKFQAKIQKVKNFFKENLLKLYTFFLLSIIFFNIFLANLVLPFFSI